MPSQRYSKMCSELSRLRRTLLPRARRGEAFDLTPRLSVRALAFRVLSHAEIEHYIEERAAEIALAADTAWKDRRHVSETTLCLLAFSGLSLAKLPATLRPPRANQRDWSEFVKPDARLSASVTTYIRRVRQENHGIKEENLLSLLLPIGFPSDELDELLIAELNDFGTKRGRAAHISVSNHVTAGVNPFDEDDQVRRIVLGLRAIDLKLDVMLRKSR